MTFPGTIFVHFILELWYREGEEGAAQCFILSVFLTELCEGPAFDYVSLSNLYYRHATSRKRRLTSFFCFKKNNSKHVFSL